MTQSLRYGNQVTYYVVLPRMPRLERTSITIPADVLRRADRLARVWGRPRSWVLAEGVRLLPEPPGAAPPAVRLDDSRRAQLASDLRLSLEDRVLAAERTAREAPARGPKRIFISFDRPEDYLEWKRLEATGQV